MSEGTSVPSAAPVPRRFAVEPVLMFAASCVCGWSQIVGGDEAEAQRALIRHRVATSCAFCSEHVEHDAAVPAEAMGGAHVMCCQDCAAAFPSSVLAQA